MTWRKNLKAFLLIASDTAIFYLALISTLVIRYALINRDLLTFYNSIPSHFTSFTIIFFIWLIVFWAAGLYDLLKLKNEELFYKTLISAFIINATIAIAFFYFTPYFLITPKTNLFIDLALTLAILCFWRRYFNRWAGQALKIGVVFLGASPEIIELKEFLKKNEKIINKKTDIELSYVEQIFFAESEKEYKQCYWPREKYNLAIMYGEKLENIPDKFNNIEIFRPICAESIDDYFLINNYDNNMIDTETKISKYIYDIFKTQLYDFVNLDINSFNTEKINKNIFIKKYKDFFNV